MSTNSNIGALISRKLRRVVRNLPNLWQGYNIYVNRNKLSLIDTVFRQFYPQARSFADFGGVWKINAAYSIHTIKKYQINKSFLVDTDIPSTLITKLKRFNNLQVIKGDFASSSVIEKVGNVDVIYLFDVLLHQANPDWDQILERYSCNCSCFVIYNQQFIRGDETIRLTDLPFGEYISIVSDHGEDITRYIYDHREEIHPKFNKPWKDIHNITQWGITDRGLRNTMTRLGFKEVFYRNYGMFINLPAFENHAFIFLRS